MNDENPIEQADLAKASVGEKEQINDKPSAPEPVELKLQLQESFKKICDRSDKFSHEFDLKREAKNLVMDVEEYRRWYELSSESSRLWPRFCRWAGFREKKLWDFLPIIIVPLVVALGTIYLQDSAKQKEQVVADDKANQDTLVKYLDQMAELLQNGLRKTKPESETFIIIAQAKTVAALQALDPKRQHLIIQFLDAANLTTLAGEKGILYEARMSKANLNKADLSWANLGKADLDEAKLIEASVGPNSSRLNFSRLISAGPISAELTSARPTSTRPISSAPNSSVPTSMELPSKRLTSAVPSSSGPNSLEPNSASQNLLGPISSRQISVNLTSAWPISAMPISLEPNSSVPPSTELPSTMPISSGLYSSGLTSTAPTSALTNS